MASQMRASSVSTPVIASQTPLSLTHSSKVTSGSSVTMTTGSAVNTATSVSQQGSTLSGAIIPATSGSTGAATATTSTTATATTAAGATTGTTAITPSTSELVLLRSPSHPLPLVTGWMYDSIQEIALPTNTLTCIRLPYPNSLTHSLTYTRGLFFLFCCFFFGCSLPVFSGAFSLFPSFPLTSQN